MSFEGVDEGMSVDENVLREFMRKYYPKYADNLALARLLYAKHMGMMAGTIPEIVSSQLGNYVGFTVKINGVLASYRVIEYQACSKCKFSLKNCRCEEKGEPETRYTYELIVGDNVSNFKALSWRSEDNWINQDDVGKEVEIIGVVAMDSEENRPRIDVRSLSFRASSVEDEKVKEILSVLRDAKKVKKTVLENMLKTYNIEMAGIQKYVKEEGDYYVWIGGENW